MIRADHPEIDDEAAGYDIHVFVVARVPTADRHQIADEALDLPGVINARESMTGDHTVHIEIVAADGDAEF